MKVSWTFSRSEDTNFNRQRALERKRNFSLSLKKFLKRANIKFYCDLSKTLQFRAPLVYPFIECAASKFLSALVGNLGIVKGNFAVFRNYGYWPLCI